MIPISALFEGHCLLSWAARHRTCSASGPAASCRAELKPSWEDCGPASNAPGVNLGLGRHGRSTLR